MGSGRRHWHVEHGDGREWTRAELESLVTETRRRYGRPVFPKNNLRGIALGEMGEIFLMDTDSDYWMFCPSEGWDMVVVWDE